MGRFQVHLARYMGTYTLLMFASYLLWQLSGVVVASSSAILSHTPAEAADGLYWLSSFLIDFAAIAYPLYVAIACLCKWIARHIGMRPTRSGGRTGRKAAASSSILG